ncbi:aldo/keto reductase [Lactobacillus sp. DCY120]|uniref:Aldo/keto reductase n=1 Tax=Bombilactobacillus apium TaxID=2675299 RepID=A0A850R304_9LACO|nr:aldo/keto reductase [Bombilactobacillus apium]NVY96381.1 aldo/keto reductase [Bombilactobacillus apium]
MLQVRLNDGVKMPQLGFGVFQMDDPKVAEQAVVDALQAGYRLLDIASFYGNEAAVGRGIARSSLARENLFVTSKLWVTDTGYEATKRAIDKSLQLLALDYLDLYLIHQPYGDIFGSWRAMAEAQAAGKIRSLGVSNFSPDRVLDLTLYSQIKPAINQIEINPWQQQVTAVNWLQKWQIQAEAWAPFAEGKQGIFRDSQLAQIGDQYGKSNGQVILRWLIQRGIVVLAKSVHPQRMAENLAVTDFQLTAKQMQAISQLDQNKSQFFDHRDPESVARIFKLH